MADVDINKFRASVVRDGSKPASPGFIVSEGQDPVDPAGTGQNHLPVTIAAAATGLSITESQVLGGAGTTLQYLRGDGSLATFPDLTGYVPYTGANQTVNLNTQQLQAGHTTLTTNGSTETLTINHTSGSGKAINVTKGGNGEGLYVNKTSGSGNAATIVGTLEATTLVKTGGTSSQFLKADGSVDSTSYGTGTVTSVGLSSATSGVTIGSSPVTTSGTITLTIATASGSQNGLLSSTDWTTFNNKQNALTNPVTGTGTTNYLPKFTGASTIGNSQIFDNGTNLGIGTTTFAFNPRLAINSIGQNSLAIQTTDTVQGSAGTILYIGTGAATGNSTFGIIRALGNGGTAATNLVLQESGNVLIGTTTDNGARLQVSGTAFFSGTLTGASSIFTNIRVNASGEGIAVVGVSGNPAYLVTDQSVNNSGKRWRFGHTGAIGGFNSFDFYNQTDNITPLTLASTGAATFSSSVTARGYGISEASAFRGGMYTFNQVAGLGTDYSIGLFSEGEIFLSSGGSASKKVVLTSSGNVLIGTTTDNGATLNVNGTIRTSAPSGGTAANWKLGTFTSGAVATGGRIRIEINGVAYDILTT